MPADELAKFEAKARGQASRHHKKGKIGADNRGHQMLQRMGWQEGQGLGQPQSSGMTEPISAHKQQFRNQGVGSGKQNEVNPDDDPFEQYKKKMMVAYRYRPNPMVTKKNYIIMYINIILFF